MPPRRRVDPALGEMAVRSYLDGEAASSTKRDAVRFLLEELATRAQGNSVEVRVPPAGVVQAVAGPRHTRGTPANVVEMDVETFLELATGRLGWQVAVDSARVAASGSRAGEVQRFLPLWP